MGGVVKSDICILSSRTVTLVNGGGISLVSCPITTGISVWFGSGNDCPGTAVATDLVLRLNCPLPNGSFNRFAPNPFPPLVLRNKDGTNG